MSQQTAINWTDHTFNPWLLLSSFASASQLSCAVGLAMDFVMTRIAKSEPVRHLKAQFGEVCKWLDVVSNQIAPACISAVLARKRVSQEDIVTPAFVLSRESQIATFCDLTILVEVTCRATGNVWRCTECETNTRPFFNRARDAFSRVGTPFFLSHTQTNINGGYEQGIQWVIVGGESGVKARPIDGQWVRSLRNQCVADEIAFFFKQWGGRTSKSNGRELDGQLWSEFPVVEAPHANVPPVNLAAD